jgi:hypothetical protein
VNWHQESTVVFLAGLLRPPPPLPVLFFSSQSYYFPPGNSNLQSLWSEQLYIDLNFLFVMVKVSLKYARKKHAAHQ